MTQKKLKVLCINDHILASSGVALQVKYVVDHLLKTGRYQFINLGGAVKHADYRPQKLEEYGDDLIIYPVDGYGTPEIVKQVMETHKPDILMFTTDPRFFEWLWEIEDEIRVNIPMVYYHVWDNYPYPQFNRKFYLSNDMIVTISKLTDDIVRTVAPEVKTLYLPHSVDMNVFCNQTEMGNKFKEQNFPGKTLFFWNSRNARRKMSGSVIWWFSEFLKEVGEDKAALLMHTDPKDQNGQDLEAIIKELDLTDGQVKFSTARANSQQMAMMYSAADATICISDAEGFGLSCMESLACETPVIVNMTGGLQEQITDGTNFFGVPIYPASKAVIGSQNVPYIYEDRISKEDFIEALHKIHSMSQEERTTLGKAGRQHLMDSYNPEILLPKWDEVFTELHHEAGSWETRKYQRWTLKEVK
jgi:glycosyltransferase involved in cell wall biosynthesis